jgi:hypothetical protein
MSFDHLAPYVDNDALCAEPIFIIGSPRSGTTILAQSLNRHPALRVNKESYLLHDLFSSERVQRSWTRHSQRATPNWLAHENVELDELLAFTGLGFNALFSSRAEGKRWIDQTPRNTPMVETLAAMFPGAQFLHIVRDGRRVVRSMVNFERKFSAETLRRMLPGEIPSWADNFAEACDTWSTWVRAGLDFADSQPARCLTVSNEELAAHSSEGFARIGEFLKLEPHPGPANFFARQRINSSFVDDPQRPGDHDWSSWPTKQREQFLALAGATMARAGYGDLGSLREWSRA